jgi:hypothetical protein
MMTPQSRWPLVTTSVSGIGPEIWESFRKRADATGVTYREAIEAAIHDLITDVQEDRQIIWYPPQPGGPFPFQIHEKVREELRALVKKVNYRQNVVLLTAIQRWLEKHSG